MRFRWEGHSGLARYAEKTRQKKYKSGNVAEQLEANGSCGEICVLRERYKVGHATDYEKFCGTKTGWQYDGEVLDPVNQILLSIQIR